MGTRSLAGKLALLHHPSLSNALMAFSNISEYKQALACSITSGRLKSSFTLARLLAFAAISESGDCNYARLLFSQIERPTFFMYNTMIRGLSQGDEPLESVNIYIQMLRAGIWPDRFTFPFLLRSCAILFLLRLGRELHSHFIKFGLDCDVFVVNNAITMYSSCEEIGCAQKLFAECFHSVDVVSWTALITGYLNCGNLQVARQMFDQTPWKNEVLWNAMIGGYARAGCIEEARDLFDRMPQRNIASWSAIISGCSQSGLCREALGLFKEMLAARISPNESILASVVSACAQLKILKDGELVHAYIKEHKSDVNLILGTALVDMYGKCGSICKAFQVFNEMKAKNLLSWNSIIAGLASNGHGKQALLMFWRMLMVGLTPNGVTFLGVLNGCSHSGLVYEGNRLFNLMARGYGIEPEAAHYGCMVDLHARAGLIKEAVDLVRGMPRDPHPGLLGALAGACQIHGEVELGEELGRLLVRLEPNHGGRYALLHNIYAAARRWNDAAKVNNLFKERSLSKSPGNSVVEA